MRPSRRSSPVATLALLPAVHGLDIQWRAVSIGGEIAIHLAVGPDRRDVERLGYVHVRPFRNGPLFKCRLRLECEPAARVIVGRVGVLVRTEVARVVLGVQDRRQVIGLISEDRVADGRGIDGAHVVCACFRSIVDVLERRVRLKGLAGDPAQDAPAADHVLPALSAELAISPPINASRVQVSGTTWIQTSEVEDFLVTVAMLGYPGDAGHQRVADRKVIARANVEPIETSVRHVDVTSIVADRFLADVTDDAADRAASEQRALWAAQHFHAVEVEKVDL